MHVKLYEDIARHGHIATTYAYPVKVDGRYLMDPSPTPKFDNPKMHIVAGAAALRRRPREAHLRRAALHARSCRSISRTIRSRCRASTSPARCAAPRASISTRSSSTTAAAACSSARTPTIARRGAGDGPSRRHVASRRSGQNMSAASTWAHADEAHRRSSCCPSGPEQILRRARRLPRRRSISVPARCWRSSASRAPASRRCSHCCRPRLAPTAGARSLPHARRRRCATLCRMTEAERPLPDAHRLGLRPPGPARGPAHDRLGRRQCRRAADGGRRAPLRPASASTALDWLGARRDRRGPHRRRSRAPSPAACASACRSPATSSPVRAWCSWTSRPAASTSRCRRACSISLRGLVDRSRPRRRHRHPRPRRGAAAVAPHMVMRRGPRHRDRPHRPGARRSARALHAASRLLGARRS